MRKVSSTEYADLFNRLRESLSASTVNHLRSALSRVYEAALRHKLVGANVIPQTKKLGKRVDEATNVQPPLSVEECMRALYASVGTDMEVFMHVLLTTGLRRGEMLGLKWSDLDLVNGSLSVRRQIGETRTSSAQGNRTTVKSVKPLKTKHSARTLRLLPGVVQVLEKDLLHRQAVLALRQEPWSDDHWVFCTAEGESFWPTNFKKKFDRFLKANGLRHIRIHDARSTLRRIEKFSVNCYALDLSLSITFLKMSRTKFLSSFHVQSKILSGVMRKPSAIDRYPIAHQVDDLPSEARRQSVDGRC